MAEPKEFPEANAKWWGPGDVSDLPAYRDESDQNISCWQLTDEEQAEVASTGIVWLHVWGQHPAVFVSGHSPFDESQPGE